MFAAHGCQHHKPKRGLMYIFPWFLGVVKVNGKYFVTHRVLGPLMESRCHNPSGKENRVFCARAQVQADGWFSITFS